MPKDCVTLNAATVNTRRIEAGWTRAQLAAQAGVSSATACKIAAGQAVTLGPATAIARALGVPFKELLSCREK